MSTEETRHVVAGYVAALQRGDIDALRASFTPKATWTIRGDIPAGGSDRQAADGSWPFAFRGQYCGNCRDLLAGTDSVTQPDRPRWCPG